MKASLLLLLRPFYFGLDGTEDAIGRSLTNRTLLKCNTIIGEGAEMPIAQLLATERKELQNIAELGMLIVSFKLGYLSRYIFGGCTLPHYKTRLGNMLLL